MLTNKAKNFLFLNLKYPMLTQNTEVSHIFLHFLSNHTEKHKLKPSNSHFHYFISAKIQKKKKSILHRKKGPNLSKFLTISFIFSTKHTHTKKHRISIFHLRNMSSTN
jgi:hypothetical protein